MEHSSATPAYSPLEYRIAIADACDCPAFRDHVKTSNSNTNAAIYYRKAHLQEIASTLGATCADNTTAGELRSAIRRFINTTQADPSPGTAHSSSLRTPIATDGGTPQTTLDSNLTARFGHEELPTLATAVDATPDPPYLEIDLRQLAGSSIAGPYLTTLIEEAHVDFYLSANVGSVTAEHGSRAYYPFRLDPVHEIPQSATSRPRCHKYIVDSSIGRDEYDNHNALSTAHRVNADAVVLADKWHNVSGTVDAILDGIALAESSPFDGQLVIPLQPPHDECYEQLMDNGVDTDYIFALGGLKNEPNDQTKINAARAVRDVATDEITLHGLGFGASPAIARAIRQDPALLDSIDSSTPLQDALDRGQPGKERLCTVAAETGAGLVESLRRLSELVADSNQQGLETF